MNPPAMLDFRVFYFLCSLIKVFETFICGRHGADDLLSLIYKVVGGGKHIIGICLELSFDFKLLLQFVFSKG